MKFSKEDFKQAQKDMKRYETIQSSRAELLLEKLEDTAKK